jgi:hypothetical protein
MFRKPVFVWGLIVSAAAIALDLTATRVEACGGGCRRGCGYSGCGYSGGCSSGCGYSGCGSSCGTCFRNYDHYYGHYAARPFYAAPVYAGTTYAPTTYRNYTSAPFTLVSRTRVRIR